MKTLVLMTLLSLPISFTAMAQNSCDVFITGSRTFSKEREQQLSDKLTQLGWKVQKTWSVETPVLHVSYSGLTDEDVEIYSDFIEDLNCTPRGYYTTVMSKKGQILDVKTFRSLKERLFNSQCMSEATVFEIMLEDLLPCEAHSSSK